MHGLQELSYTKTYTHFQEGLRSPEVGLDAGQMDRGITGANTVLKIDISATLETRERETVCHCDPHFSQNIGH